MRVYNGVVCRGKGEFAYWLTRLDPIYYAKLHLHLFPGTLNVDIGVPYRIPSTGFVRIEPDEMATIGGHVGVKIALCKIFDLDAFVLRTDANDRGDGDHPLTLIEVAATIKLRDQFRLTDGSVVQLTLP
jgi:CTP-dependent riboflavin kinase